MLTKHSIIILPFYKTTGPEKNIFKMHVIGCESVFYYRIWPFLDNAVTKRKFLVYFSF